MPKLEGWQISPYYQPAREVGGDFYDFHSSLRIRLGLVVGDATGKGVPAACDGHHLRHACSSQPKPGLLLAGRGTRAGQRDVVARIPSNMFVTCFYAILEPESGSLPTPTRATTCPTYTANGDAEELRARGMPLGLMPGMGYEEKETFLQAGEAALFYSDGLVEAHDPKGEMFGFPRLRALVAEHGEERVARGLPVGGALLLRRGGLGAGGRHHPPYAGALRDTTVNKAEVREGT